MSESAFCMRIIWMTKSVRRSSADRLNQYVRQQRQRCADSGLSGLVLADGLYRLHLLEGQYADVNAEYDCVCRVASGVGVRLISKRASRTPIFKFGYGCLDLSEAVRSGAVAPLEELYQALTIPGAMSQRQVQDYLRQFVDGVTLCLAA